MFGLAALLLITAQVSVADTTGGSTVRFSEYQTSGAPVFSFVKKYGSSTEVFTKMTARFRYPQESSDGTFYATYWKPEKTISSLIFVSHGYGGYLSQEFDEMAKHLSQQVDGGALVFGHEHAGHGRTTTGDRALVTDMKDFTGPIIAHVREMQKWIKDGDKLPVFIVGSGFGGLIALHTVLKIPSLFNGFIGVGTMVKLPPSQLSPQRVYLAELLAKFFPSFGHPLIDPPTYDCPNSKEADINRDDDALYFHGGMKAAMQWLMIRETQLLQEKLADINLPMLILSGGSDTVVDPAGSRMLYKESSSTKKDFKEYPETCHHLLTGRGGNRHPSESEGIYNRPFVSGVHGVDLGVSARSCFCLPSWPKTVPRFLVVLVGLVGMLQFAAQ